MTDPVPVSLSYGWALFAWLVCAGVGSIVGGRTVGHPVVGFLISLVFGPVGWVLVLIVADERRRCHDCTSYAHARATHCHRCGAQLRIPPEPATSRVEKDPRAASRII